MIQGRLEARDHVGSGGGEAGFEPTSSIIVWKFFYIHFMFSLAWVT